MDVILIGIYCCRCSRYEVKQYLVCLSLYFLYYFGAVSYKQYNTIGCKTPLYETLCLNKYFGISVLETTKESG